ncbi:MAG: LysR family transcriptional regulator [Pseudomonadota bacterium]
MRHLKTFELIEAVVRAGSIRKAAEDTNLTASALNRRIQAFEQEFGWPIFERLPRGMRLNPAGELLMQHIQSQRTDLSRIQSQVADLSGERRGHVSIACSQALLPYFLPEQIAIYRAAHPGVTFSVSVRDRSQAERDLASFSSDLALVFEPVHLVEFEVLYALVQPVHAVFPRKSPLGRNRELRLRDCLDQRLVLPAKAYGVRHLLEEAAARRGLSLNASVESESFELIRHYVLHENAVGFQIPIGLNLSSDNLLTHRAISSRDVRSGQLLLGQMKGRALPVASSKFAHQLALALAADPTVSEGELAGKTAKVDHSDTMT